MRRRQFPRAHVDPTARCWRAVRLSLTALQGEPRGGSGGELRLGMLMNHLVADPCGGVLGIPGKRPTVRRTQVEFRYLGNSGFKISEITYGNWLTHGSQVENEQAHSCVRAALEAGISTFDTADVYANTRAETVLGEALKGERRESLEILTKVFGPIGPKGHNDVGLSRKHIMEAANGSLKRLQTDYIDLYQAHRYDYETPLEETMQAFADLVRMGKVLYVGVSEWTADQLRDGHALAEDLGFQLISNQPQYSMLWRVIEGEVVPVVAGARHLPGRLVTDRPGRADRQVPAGRAAAGGLAGHRREGWREHDRALDAATTC